MYKKLGRSPLPREARNGLSETSENNGPCLTRADEGEAIGGKRAAAGIPILPGMPRGWLRVFI